jgi:hypothetical protein
MKLTVVATIAILGLVGCGGAPQTPTYHAVTIRSGRGTAGTRDPEVQASSDGKTWRQAYEVAPNENYSTIPGTDWDSISPDPIQPPGNYHYRVLVNLPSNVSDAYLQGSYYSDNGGSVWVNGFEVADNNFDCGDPLSGANFGLNDGRPTSFTPVVLTLVPGSNTISFNVENCGPTASPTGVDFTVTVHRHFEVETTAGG